MNAPVPKFVKRCPSCGGERSPIELSCEAVLSKETECGYDLSDEPVVPQGGTAAAREPTVGDLARPMCENGHGMDQGDLLCLECGAGVAPISAPAPGEVEPTAEPAHPTAISGWVIIERLPSLEATPCERFLVSDRSGSTTSALLTLYGRDAEPDPAVSEALRRMPNEHVPRLLDSGRHDRRAFEVVERVPGGSIADAYRASVVGPECIRSLIKDLGKALAEFADIGLRHRDIRPENILIRSEEPLDVVVTGFGFACLSDFDLEAVTPLKLTRYSAPEAIVGAVSTASDWWSLGVIVLELATGGACFEGVNDQALLLHIVTRGVDIPRELDPGIRLLLRGLLSRDPGARWSWTEVKAWLDGKAVLAPDEPAVETLPEIGPAITLSGHEYRRPEAFVLAAAEAANWSETSGLILRGAFTLWLERLGADARAVAEVRRIAADDELPEEQRVALALMAANCDLPVVLSGQIVTPAWLLQNHEAGYELIVGPLTRHLERMERETWLVRLRSRAEAVRERARLLEIGVDEPRLRVALLATSRAKLEVERERLGRMFPDSDHNGLASLLERGRLPIEDLIVLVSASLTLFIPLDPLIESAAELAVRTGVAVDRQSLTELLSHPRRVLFNAVNERISNFSRCGIVRVDEWADSFRMERRLPVTRAAVLLSVPKESWKQPPKQQYVTNLLEHFEKRVSASAARGPLVRFLIGKTTPRVDALELGTATLSAETIANHLVGRNGQWLELDPSGYMADPAVAGRLRRLVNQAVAFRRDTGIDGLYMGFPFLLLRGNRSSATSATTRILPLFLWPISLEMPSGMGQGARIAFDRARDEVRLNPSLETLVGSSATGKWNSARQDILARESPRVGDVMDILSHLAAPQERRLVRVPGRDAKVAADLSELVSAAALFNAEFTGQAVAEDLRQLRGKPVAATALEVVLRIADAPVRTEAPKPAERDRYLTVESDPSQEDAVLRSGQAPGLVVEGPPGTGKSQTIVNIVANAVGHGQTVLVVCQKQAALQVVKKRLDAEGLGDRLFSIVDANRDRAEVVTALQAQVQKILTGSSLRNSEVRRQREETAARIESLEGEIDRCHRAFNVVDQDTGMAYRSVLADLVRLEAAGSILAVPRLRPLVGQLKPGMLSALEETCGPLADTWMRSGFEGSPLSVLKQFSVDDGTVDLVRSDLLAFLQVEKNKAGIATYSGPDFETEDLDSVRGWLGRECSFLEALNDDERSRLADWFDLFSSEGGRSRGDASIEELSTVCDEAAAIDPKARNLSIFLKLLERSDADLVSAASDLKTWARGAGLFDYLNPNRWFAWKRVRTLAGELEVPAEVNALDRLRGTVELELAVRPLRHRLASIMVELGLEAATGALGKEELRQVAADLLENLRCTRNAALQALACPATALAVIAVKSRTSEGYRLLRDRLEAACARCAARMASLEALRALDEWVDDAKITEWRSRLERGDPPSPEVHASVAETGRLAAYQEFRARAASLDRLTLSVFAILRGFVASFESYSMSELGLAICRIVRREALLATKGRLESSHPELLYGRDEIGRKTESLAHLDASLRALNKDLLANELDPSRLGSAAAWNAMTVLRGPRARRLREIFDAAPDIGLMHLRPVWLMNPDVASRMLPLRAGLFDLIVYDEASQMPVEHAVPTLFRAKRAVISGDEKQMPPSSFFTSSTESEEEEDGETDLADEGATESEREEFEEKWNRREVKDYPDLLQLGRSVLPVSTLQIHYRSKYRELIGFSNAAFYQGTLSVPVQHPKEEIRRARPVELLRVDGVYSSQTNPSEADAVVGLLKRYWSEEPARRPTIGVVTFNKKQADLIDDAVERLALEDETFLEALRRERDRKQDGEEMGFFVKNVENVQGDERDVIIFSTTFGRDARGNFRRSFGVLGNSGGERRLNVAVTRAREKMILVTSIPVADVSDWLKSERLPSRPRDFLQAFLDQAAKLHACDFEAVGISANRMLPRSSRRAATNLGGKDAIADAVAGFVRCLGYDPVPADGSGDAFSLDFAVVDARTGLFGLGIECDAPSHPLLERARAREIWRKQVLSRAIPMVHRVSSRDWYSNPSQEKARLRDALESAIGQGVPA